MALIGASDDLHDGSLAIDQTLKAKQLMPRCAYFSSYTGSADYELLLNRKKNYICSETMRKCPSRSRAVEVPSSDTVFMSSYERVRRGLSPAAAAPSDRVDLDVRQDDARSSGDSASSLCSVTSWRKDLTSLHGNPAPSYDPMYANADPEAANDGGVYYNEIESRSTQYVKWRNEMRCNSVSCNVEYSNVI